MINGKSVSLCMVAFNNADLTAKAIESAKEITDEVVIVDQGSNPEESEKFKKLANVYHYTTNKGNADYDRQFCYALANKDYILAMDSDELLTEEVIRTLKNTIEKYDFDLAWFMFHNTIFYSNGDGTEVKMVDIHKLLGDDPHPRFWKSQIDIGNGQRRPPIIWGNEAHQFPQIVTQKQVFLECKFEHSRDLKTVINTHLRRSQNISPQAVQTEKNFVRSVLQEFGFELQKKITHEIPELKHYLKD